MRYCINRLVVVFAISILYSCSTQAEFVNYIGCDWVVPSGFEGVAENEFTKLDDLSNFSSVDFRLDDDPEERGTARILNDPAFIVKHEKYDIGRGMETTNLFMHRRGSDSYSFSFFIKKDGHVVSLVGVSYDDAATLSQYCIERSYLRSFYDDFEQWKQDIKAQ